MPTARGQSFKLISSRVFSLTGFIPNLFLVISGVFSSDLNFV